MKKGQKAQVSPTLSGLDKWIEGVVIKIFNNPFLGTEIAIKDKDSKIFYDEKKYFKTVPK